MLIGGICRGYWNHEKREGLALLIIVTSMKRSHILSLVVLLCISGCSSSTNGPVLDNAKNPPLTPLEKPLASEGFQIYMEPFEIPAETEKEIFKYKKSPVNSTQFVNKVQFRMRQGSHHFVLYTVNGVQEGLVDGAIRTDVEAEMQRPSRQFVFGAQTPNAEFTFPPGVAMRMNAGAGLDLNAHYVNHSSDLYKGEAYINLFTVPESQVQHVAQPLLNADMSFTIPANTQSYTRSYNWGAFDRRTHLFLLTSHAHKRMLMYKVFKISAASGDTIQIYNTFNWHEPDVVSTDIIFEPGDELYSETTWRNETDKPIAWGSTSEDEMNVIYGYYWQE